VMFSVLASLILQRTASASTVRIFPDLKGSETVYYGQSIELLCNASVPTATAVTDDTKLKWERTDGAMNLTWPTTRPVTGTDDKGYITIFEARLSIKGVSRSVGTYRCSLINLQPGFSVVGQTADRTVKRIVPVKPKATGEDEEHAPKEVESKVEEDVTLDCGLDVVPPPTYKWTRDDKKAITEVSSVLKLVKVTKQDRALFTCKIVYKGEGVNGTEFKMEKQYRVRVRDSMDAVYPVIGILIGGIVLAVILVLAEKTNLCIAVEGCGKPAEQVEAIGYSGSDGVKL